MKKILLSLLILFSVFSATAQDKKKSKTEKKSKDKFAKLFDLYSKGKFEDCAYKAENYTMRESTRKSPMPYLYLTLCNLELYKIPEMNKKYPKCFPDAMKNASKFRKFDNNNTLYNENRSSFMELTELAVLQADSIYNIGKFSKAANFYKKIYKFNKENYFIELMEGVANVKANVATIGVKQINAALEGLKTLTERDFKQAINKYLYVKSVVEYSDFLNNAGRITEAVDFAKKGQEQLPNNPEIDAQIKKLNG